jgi:hypothetical protein
LLLDLSPDLIRDLIPDLTPELIRDLIRDLTPELIHDLIPDLTPDLIPDLFHLLSPVSWLEYPTFFCSFFLLGNAIGLYLLVIKSLAIGFDFFLCFGIFI